MHAFIGLEIKYREKANEVLYFKNLVIKPLYTLARTIAHHAKLNTALEYTPKQAHRAS